MGVTNVLLDGVILAYFFVLFYLGLVQGNTRVDLMLIRERVDSHGFTGQVRLQNFTHVHIAVLSCKEQSFRVLLLQC